jgi:hypothetical protein
MSRLQNVKSQYQYVYRKVLTPELLELGAIFTSAEISAFLEYKSMLKELYCVSEAPLVVLKFEFSLLKGT